MLNLQKISVCPKKILLCLTTLLLLKFKIKAKIVRLKEKAPDGLMMVDGFSVGDIQEVVIRDRQMLAQDGMFVIIASINTSTGKLKKVS
jgi:mRNA degradation ribonuclease J1/J2